MTNEFMFIGEDKDNDDRLLVKGADGEYYAYTPEHDRFEQVEPDQERWIREVPEPEIVPAPDPIPPSDVDWE